MGDRATLINIGGQGSQRWKVAEDKGTHESNPFVRRAHDYIKLGREQRDRMNFTKRLLTGAIEKTYGPLPFISDSNPSHIQNWLECLRSRKDPDTTVDDGFAHSVVAIMSARAAQRKEAVCDPVAEEITETPLAAQSARSHESLRATSDETRRGVAASARRFVNIR
jgi:hypothetical protein